MLQSGSGGSIILDINEVAQKTMQIQMSATALHPTSQYQSAYRVRAKVSRTQVRASRGG